MTILRSGTTKKYSDNWGAAFGAKKKSKAKPKAAAKSKKTKTKKSPSKK
ncbi:MAG: hypothetical protein P8L78_17100 [Mariniblastus sp.]|jgi:hypothetical protein|nr:hypothetical protein [Planctomycetaceae bacterium]MCP4479243.1 hypothetical protein [Planctomycetaceae bacterium]MCP4777304.1 hypothetical protein [Planctomycetaceae bacterium]MDG1511410.1 hypothetical protein [Mariniblastus sp.]MDG2183412.1 hypothetical protein [Mariniblastus sp.]